MKLLLAVLALISAGPVPADCPKAVDWARAFYSEHYSFYADPSDRVLQFTTPEFGALLREGMGIFEWRDRASGLRPLAWRPGWRNWQAGSLLRRNAVAGYGNCLHVISVRPSTPSTRLNGTRCTWYCASENTSAGSFKISSLRAATRCYMCNHFRSPNQSLKRRLPATRSAFFDESRLRD